MKYISRSISILFFIVSLLLLAYVFYRSEIYSAGSKHDEYFRYYIISFFFILLSIISFFLEKETKIKITIVLISIFIGLYTVEGYFFLKQLAQKKITLK